MLQRAQAEVTATMQAAAMPVAKATGIEAADMMSRRAIDVFQA